MTTTYFRPFDYRVDGAFTRASKAWYETDAGLVVEVAANERRIQARGPSSWIWIEGARENYVAEPLRTDNVAWDTPAGATEVLNTPMGVATVGVMENIDTIAQEYLAGPHAALAASSYYGLFVPASPPALFYIELTNVAGDIGGDAEGSNTEWVRLLNTGSDLSPVGAKEVHLTCDARTAAWGVVVETGPGFTDARFVSQPILETGVRAQEDLTVGVFIEEFLTVQGTVESKGFRIEIEPEFAATDTANGDVFQLVCFDTGVAATSVLLWMENTAGDLEVRLGDPAGVFINTNAITFSRGQRLTITVFFDFVGSGGASSLEVSGATSGNGTVTGGYFVPVAGSEIVIGGTASGAFVDSPSFALFGPLELIFPGFKVGSIDQLTLNSIRVAFVDDNGAPVDVLKFDPRGDTDALNPANYLITGSPGLPFVQYVQPTDVGSEVVLFFDAELAPGLTVTISPSNIAMAGPVPIIIGDGSTGGFSDAFYELGFWGGVLLGLTLITFGDEVNLVAQAQAMFPRVDIANPQTEIDATQDEALGTFAVTDAGDLANDHGRTYLRKRIYRRLTTAKDGFFHLPGYGLAQPSKVLFTPTVLRRLKVDIEAQVRQEPGVLAALAAVTELRPGVVAVKLRIQDDNGSFELEDALDFNAE